MPWLLTVASPSGSTADVTDLAFARACPWLEQGQAQRHADLEGDVRERQRVESRRPIAGVTTSRTALHEAGRRENGGICLIPYLHNARTHSEDHVAQIAGSMREFGFTNPVLIDDETASSPGMTRAFRHDATDPANRPRGRRRALTGRAAGTGGW
jgi:hypothetical protein